MLEKVISIDATNDALEQLEAHLNSFLASYPRNTKQKVYLALHELCLNIVRHAYCGAEGKIEIRFTLDDHHLKIETRDSAPSRYHPSKAVDPLEAFDISEGGWGIHILTQVMDFVGYTHSKTGNVWYARKMLDSQPSIKHILVIDDEATILRLVTYMLRSFTNIKVKGARTPAEALSIVDIEKFDLLLVDLNLPDIDGIQLMQQLRDKPSLVSVPFLVFTARNRYDDLAQIKQYAVSDILYKPFSTQELRHLVKKYLDLEDDE